MKWLFVVTALSAALSAQAQVVAAAAVTVKATDDLLGGGGTVRDSTNNAFSMPSPLLTAAERRAFAVGNSFFKHNWVAAPSSVAGLDGLGPLFNARSCSSCHMHDGRSRPPEHGQTDQGLLIRIGVRTGTGPDLPHPVYGGQIRDDAIPGVQPEAHVAIDNEPVAGEYGDGTPFELLAPKYELRDLAYGPLGENVVLGPRVGPQLIGLGLLEAIPAERILALADPDDSDGDGISGRPNFGVDGAGARVLGRFGWKATQPTVLAQTAAAFVNDMGITSRLFPDEAVTAAERERISAEGMLSGGNPEIDDHKLERVVFYTRTLGVPAQRTPHDPQVMAGRVSFRSFGCTACHVETFTTGDTAFHPAFVYQTIHPYTDLLLHDLGPGLADGKRDGEAGPAEWRTPPLWGIGLVPEVNGHERYLHDGRARGLAEAVLWHGGEAEAAKERFRKASGKDREALLAFLRSL